MGCVRIAVSGLVPLCALALFLWGFFLVRVEFSEVAVPLRSFEEWDAQFGELLGSELLAGRPADAEVLRTGVQARFRRQQQKEGREAGEERMTMATTKKKKVVFFIVDAMRADFLAKQGEAGVMKGEDGHWQPTKFCYNNWHFAHSLVEDRPEHALMFTFLADPPTTTSQRLKGMTAGSLPTFIDMGENFNSDALAEDNWVHQAIAAGYEMCFLGDDTWTKLFPDAFRGLSKPFPSFDTRDLDTVDFGILKDMDTALRGLRHDRGETVAEKELETRCDILVMHFLGVDHVGHTFDADHPNMRDRLRLMDKTLKRVVEALPEDSLLLLMGDHGMTDEGEHGGATREETHAALMVFSTEPVFGAPDHHYITWDSGTFDFRPVNRTHHHTRIVDQVDLVPTLSVLLGLPIPYSNLGGIVPELFVSPAMGGHGLNDALLDNALQVWRYLQHYQRQCAAFPQDNLDSLQHTLQDALHLHASLLRGSPSSQLQKGEAHAAANGSATGDRSGGKENEFAATAKYREFVEGTLAMARLQWTQFNVPLLSFSLAVLASWFAWMLVSDSPIMPIVRTVQSHAAQRPIVLVCGLAIVLQSVVAFSNSFVEAEKQILLSVCVALLLSFALAAPLVNSAVVSSGLWTRLLLAIAATACLRVSMDSSGLNTVHADQSKLHLKSAACWAAFGLGIVHLAESHERECRGNAVRERPALARVLGPGCAFLSYVATLAFWLTLRHTDGVRRESDVQPHLGSSASLRLYLPRLSLLCSMGPLLLCGRVKGVAPLSLSSAMHWINLIGLVMGPSAMRSVVLLAMAAVFTRLLLLHVDMGGWRPSSRTTTSGASDRNAAMTSVATRAVLAFSLARFAFFGTDHRTQVAELHLNSAFIGVDHFNFLAAFILIATNTYGPGLMMRSILYPAPAPADRQIAASAHAYAHAYYTYQGVAYFCAALAALLLRRHLMVWAIFAPKFIFEASFLIVHTLAFWFTTSK